MRQSIRRQFALIFTALMALTVFLCMLISSLFLEKYYTASKIKTILKAYNVISETAKLDNFKLTESIDRLDTICNVSNIAACVIDANSEVVYLSMNGGKDLEAQLFRRVFGMEQGKASVIEETEKYVLLQERIGKGGDSLILFSSLESGVSIILRTPIESIRESADVANRFFLYAGLIGALFGGIVIWFVSGRVSKPIRKLNAISEEMVQLHFGARYEGRESNEIGMLGQNINKLSASLEKAISELKTANNELQRDIEKKEQIDEMRKEFLANVSHELKTPIALIQGYAEGLTDGVVDDEESRKYYCEVIADEAAKMNRLVQKLLTLNQLEFGNEVVELERINITELVRGCLQSAGLLAAQNELDIIMGEYPAIYVWGDEYKIEEVITNYFSNAVNHCSGEKKIIIKMDKRDKVLRVSVFNTGDPIPEDAIPHIWEKFYKVDKARTREYGGSGVGLSIVKAIMDSMNRGYGVENHSDGVLFWFELELCEINGNH